MRRLTLIRSVIVLLVFAASFSLVWNGRLQTHRPAWHGAYVSKKTINHMPASLGNGEDLSGRDYYEWMRLHDPNTGVVPPQIRDRELAFSQKLPSRITGLRKGEGALTANWAQRGPFNVGGRTRALGIDPRDPEVMLAGGVSGGMWRSTDAGSSWQKVAPFNDIQSTTCLAQDLRSGRQDTWYYGTGELRGNSASGGGGSLYRGDGIFKSTDNGLTWNKLASTSTANVFFDQPFDYVWNIALSRTDLSRDIVVAATLGTIQTSTDGGLTWSIQLGTIVNDAGPRYTDVISTPGGVFYATLSSKNLVSANTNATHKGIWRSPDGLTWVNIIPPAWPTDYNRVVAAFAPSDPDVVYFLAETPDTGPTGHMLWKYTFLSGDGSGSGGAWENRSAFLPNENGLDGNAVFGSQTSYDLVVAVHPTDPDMVYIGAINLYRSNNGGQTAGTWTRIGGYATPNTYGRYTNNHPDHHALLFHPADPNILYNGNDGGVFRTNDAAAISVVWTALNRGYYTTQFYTVTLDPGTGGDLTVVGGMQDNGTWYTVTSNVMSPWDEVAGGDGSFCQVEPGGEVLYVSFQNGVTYKISENGQGRIDPSGGTGYLFINPYLLDPAEPSRMYMAGGATVWRNSNLAQIPLGSSDPAAVNWVKVLQPEISGASVTALGASKEPVGILYVGSSAGRVYKLVGAHNGVPAAVDLSVASTFPGAAYVSSIAVDPYNADHVVVCFSNYGVPSIFATADGGSSWNDVSGNLEENADGSGNGPSVRWVSMLPDSTAYHYFAATSTGLYTTRSLAGAGTIWQHEGTGTVGYTVVNMIDVRYSDGHVVVGTHGRGAFSATIPVVKPPPVVPPPVVPQTFALSENFPNPFNAGTAVTVSVPEAGRVTIDVYDIAGRRIRRVANSWLAAGTSNPFIWDGRDDRGTASATGVYLIVARTSASSSVTKAALIR